MGFKVNMFILLLSVATVGLFLTSRFNDWLQDQPQNLSACEKWFSRDNEFLNHHLNCIVEPFLPTRCNLSENTFKWWKSLQKEKRNLSSYEATVNNLFEIFPPVPDLGKPRTDRYRTCAVVGNSANLKRSHYGPLIDYYDVVIRMNFAPIKGYEEDVGTKTTHRVMYPESAVDLDNSTHLVLFPFKIQDLEWLIKAFTTGFKGRTYTKVKSKMAANKELVMVVNPGFMKYVHEIWLNKKGAYPSTGFMTLVLALHICDEVYVFGYGADHNGNWSHYWETLGNKKLRTGLHPGQHEYKAIKEMAAEKSIHFYEGF